MMRCLAALGFLLSAATSAAEPFVPGFERFHATQPSADGGRLLFNELGCANCHGGATGLPPRRGPGLAGITQRARATWVEQFLANPAEARSGSSMPHFAALADAAAREAVLHYLASLKAPAAAKSVPLRHINTDRGAGLFHTQGCVACHAPALDFQPPDGRPDPAALSYSSAALPMLEKKYTLPSLVKFLQAPLEVRSDGRMPHLKLTDEAASDIAGYLLNFKGSDGTAETLPSFVAHPDSVARGQKIVSEQRCAACHDLPKETATTNLVAMTHLNAGCLADQPASTVPQYGLSKLQRLALAQFLNEQNAPLTPKAKATLTLQSLNCMACHERDGLGGPDAARKAYFQGDHNLGDTGRFPPPLTAVGRKLQPEWLVKVLTGEARVRPYLQTKMPIHSASAKELAALLAAADTVPEVPLPGGDDTAGRKLVGTLGGLGCITCHRWGERPALGIQALDISNLGQRLQPGWLRDYLVHPAGYRPGTLMPSFWPEGKAANTTILQGDTDRQIASIYAFAKSANGEPEGFPANTHGEFELTPQDRPIVQRTFLADVGTHAILVGFPSGTHLAYDGKLGRPALAWQGKFFDAYNTWFSRFAPFEKPLGSAVVRWPEPDKDAPMILCNGYRLDAAGGPTFLLSVGGVSLEERFEGLTQGLRRSITWDATAPIQPAIQHPTNVTVTEEPTSAPGHRTFTYSWK